MRPDPQRPLVTVIHRAATVLACAALLLPVLSALPGPAAAQEEAAVKIGVVRMNEALNESVAGQRSKKILLASKNQKEQELKAKEEELKQLNEQIQNNMMLSEQARGEKQQELRQRQQQLREAVRQAQQELQERERQLTQSIFTELQTVVDLIARERNFDFVLEQGASQVILFSKYEFVDITDDVIARYNKMESGDQNGGQDASAGE